MSTTTAKAIGTAAVWLAIGIIGWHDPACGVFASVAGIFATAEIW